MAVVRPPLNPRPSASATDTNSAQSGADAAQAESDRYIEHSNPNYGGGGRHQLAGDASFAQYSRRGK